ncbi:sel1 domain protein repeat-containing protein [Glaciecola punicea ACAM 611]|uniref:Sel1 domain protein repeat-containing protein n=1 Tax=Glaciecola punicea ACAM 611 TaxID=1121923 RepID=H5T9Q0_9ALTE|nr:tetratricopeptide repeat protein [Glaciecola punicea]GAB55027.1 sel1 domain protein repeat-containing protein [Glaciecola punicea ACAM 611]
MSATAEKEISKIEVIQQLAQDGDAKAQYNLGIMYHSGKGVLKDFKEAVKWHRLAAEQGIAVPQLHLGFMYYSAEGVPQSFISSYSWANISRYNGNDAKLIFDFLENKMSMNDISKAQALSKRCLESNYKNCGS